MCSSQRNATGNGIPKLLRLCHFHGLKEELARWRVDAFVREIEKEKRAGRILGFIRGLRLSARLVYALRDHLSSTGVEVHWGHIVDVGTGLCSPECDVIIHKPGSRGRWNGTEEPVMDFRFIDSRLTVAVVSCKSLIHRVDRGYCHRMAHYVANVLLFAECCHPARVKGLRRAAQEAGYRGFWYLYAWEPESSKYPHDETVWEDFLSQVEKLVTKHLADGQA